MLTLKNYYEGTKVKVEGVNMEQDLGAGLGNRIGSRTGEQD